MNMFSTRKPRRFSHTYVYADDRADRVRDLERMAGEGGSAVDGTRSAVGKPEFRSQAKPHGAVGASGVAVMAYAAAAVLLCGLCYLLWRYSGA